MDLPAPLGPHTEAQRKYIEGSESAASASVLVPGDALRSLRVSQRDSRTTGRQRGLSEVDAAIEKNAATALELEIIVGTQQSAITVPSSGAVFLVNFSTRVQRFMRTILRPCFGSGWVVVKGVCW